MAVGTKGQTDDDVVPSTLQVPLVPDIRTSKYVENHIRVKGLID